MERFDFIFAGWGLSGMSLLLEMSNYPSFREKRVLILDREEKRGNDRTWSFWSRSLYGLEEVVYKSWDRVGVIDPSGEVINLRMGDYQYRTIRSEDYYAHVWEQVTLMDNVTFRVDEIVSVAAEGVVIGKEGEYEGNMVFNSWFLREEFDFDREASFLWQHFKGFFVTLEEDRFDPGRAILMDYRGSGVDRMNFFYVLPFDRRRALIEFTEFSQEFYSQEEYDERIHRYLKEYLGIEDMQVDETEFNAIPMTDQCFGPLVNGRIISIGTKAGYVKPSSGYCFTRTLEKNRKLAEKVMHGLPVVEADMLSSWRFRLYDSIMLSLLADGSVAGREVFPAMFRRAGGEGVFRFLDEEAGWWTELRAIASVPQKMKYARRLLKYVWQKT